VYISIKDLAIVFGLSSDALYKWPQEYLPRRMASGLFRFSDINEWLAEPGRARGFAVPPTIDRFVTGGEILIRQAEAAELISEVVSMKTVSRFVGKCMSDGRLEALCLRPGTWVVTRGSVQRFMQKIEEQSEDFTVEQVFHILGITRVVFYDLVKKGRIVITRRVDNLAATIIPRESLVAYLEGELRRVGARITAEDWIDDRLQSSEPLLMASEAALRLGLMEDEFNVLLLGGKFHFIASPSDYKYCITPDSVEYVRERQKPVSLAGVSRVFGVTQQRAYQWRTEKRLVCPLHPDVLDCGIYRGCLVAIAAPLVGPGVNAVSWVRTALTSKTRKLVSEDSLVAHRMLTAAQCRDAIKAGRIPTIVTPAGRRMCVLKSVKQEASRLRQSR
jgi:hypothetical protein